MKTRMFIVALGFVLALGAGAPHAAVAGLAAQQPPQDEGFVPVTDLSMQEQLPAAPLVIAAYSIAWVAIFVYLWSVWRRLGRVEQEIAAIRRRVEAASRPEARG